jgi:hypothetical protein
MPTLIVIIVAVVLLAIFALSGKKTKAKCGCTPAVKNDGCCGGELQPTADTNVQAPVVQPPKVSQAEVETTKIIKIKKETERFVSDDEIKFRAYMIASADGFKGDAREYWIQAEKELKDSK